MSKKNSTIKGVQISITKILTLLWIVGVTTNPMLAGDPVRVVLEKSDIHDVQVQAEFDGTVVVYHRATESEQELETTLPIQVRAALKYEEKMLSSRHAIRNYRTAASDITIDKGQHQTELTEHNRSVGVFLSAGRTAFPKPILYSSQLDIFEQSELELISTPFDYLALSGFFSRANAEIGQAWQPTDQDLANVLAIDLIYTNDVQLTVKTANAQQTKIYITGKATGSVDGEDVSYELSGVTLIDNQKDKVKALRVTINESRVAGQIAPGFVGTVKIDMRAQVKNEVEHIPGPVLARVSKFRPQKLAWKPSNDFKLFFDPRWRMIVDEDDAAVFRLIENGDLLAQCNIVQLPNRPTGNLMKLKAFEAEVGKIIGHADAEIVTSSESQSSRGLSVLRVDVEGAEQEVPIHWVYFHVAHNDGRRLTFMFSGEQEVYERFEMYSKPLVDSLVFKPKKKESTASRNSASGTQR